MFQGNPAEKVAKAVSAPEVKKPGEPIKLPSFGLDAGTIALPGELMVFRNALLVIQNSRSCCLQMHKAHMHCLEGIAQCVECWRC